MNEPNKITLKLTTTKTNKFIVSIKSINSSEKEIIIKLNKNNKQEEYNPSITFTDSSFSICDENEINLLEELNHNPEEFKFYTIQFQHKQYSVLFEVLFAIIISEFKKSIEKEFIITKTIIEFEKENKIVKERIKIALQAIGLKGIIIKTRKTEYKYEDQGSLLNELLERINEYQHYQHMIEKAKEQSMDKIQKEELIHSKRIISNEESFYEEMINKFSTKERTQMNLCRLDNYCLFIASRYFDSINDHINFIFVSKRLRNNMEKFHYNPVSITKKTKHYFPNIETQHLYTKEDKYIEGGRIIQYVDWNKKSYSETQTTDKKKKERKIEYKKIIWMDKDTKTFSKIKETGEVIIPLQVKEMDHHCFFNYWYFEKLVIPETVNHIPQRCLEYCFELTSITLPLKNSHIICNNKIFLNSPKLKQYIYLTDVVKEINGKEVNWFTTFTIPSFVTSLAEDSFFKCSELENLVIPETVKIIPKYCLKFINSLTNITIPLNKSQLICGNQIFDHFNNHLKHQICLPIGIKIINNEQVNGLKVIIPSTITSLDENCFETYNNFTEISFPNSIQQFPKNCLKKCSNLANIHLPLNQTRFVMYGKIFGKNPHLEQIISLPKSIKSINDNNISFFGTIEIPSFVTSLDENCFDGFDYFLRELIIPSTVKIIPKKCFESVHGLKKLTIPIDDTQMIIDNKIFSKTSHFDQVYNLPFNIKRINNKKVNSSYTITIPSFVTSLDENCFDCYCLHQQVIIPDSVQYIPRKTVLKLTSLTSLILPSKFEVIENKVFFVFNKCLEIFELPKKLKTLNKKQIEKYEPLKTYTIPTNVTKLSDYCFANCEELTEIKGLENIKEFGKGCFLNCPKLDREQYPLVKQNIKEYLVDFINEEEQKQLESWSDLKCNEIIFDSDFDDWSFQSNQFKERIIKKKQLLFLIEDTDGEKFGYFENTSICENDFKLKKSDLNSFAFNLKSNGRLPSPMKFESKTEWNKCNLSYKSDSVLITIGDIHLCKKESKNQSFCEQNEDIFNYHGFEKGLCGKIGEKCWGEKFVPKRFVVVQMN